MAGWGKIAMCAIVCMGCVAPLNATMIHGKRVYVKYLKKTCDFKGDVMGKMHTQNEWKKLYKSGKLYQEIKRICPKAPPITKKRDLEGLYDFLHGFAKDSGNIPSCN